MDKDLSSPASRSAANRKRKNVSRACDACRRRRTKCNAARPSCSRCLEHDTNCIYDKREDGRKPASKLYVEQLRGRISLLEQVLQKHAIDAEAEFVQIKAASPNTGGSGPSPSPTFTFSSPALARQAPQGGALSKDEALNFDKDDEIRYYGPSSGRVEFLNRGKPVLPTAIGGASYQYDDPLDLDVGQQLSKEAREELIELFFTWHSPWSHVVDEELFRDSRKTCGRWWSPLLECCILSFGARFTDLADIRTDPDDPNTAGRNMYERAEVLLVTDLKRPKLTTIQSLSLMCSLHVAFGADAAGYLCQGMASRLAVDMGLNIDAAMFATPSPIPTEEIELRRKIYWALYCDDKLASAYTGRVCTMLDLQASVRLPVIHPQPDARVQLAPDTISSYDMRSRAHLSALVHRSLISLSQIFEKISTSLYPPNPRCQENQRAVFYESCSLELITWFYDQPAELRVDRPGPVNTIPQAFTLLMVYYTTSILLAKAYLRKPTVASESAEQSTSDDAVTASANLKLIDSAKQICALGRKYRHVYGSFRCSPITATHCTLTAAMVLLHLQPNSSDNKSNSSPKLHPDLKACLKVLDELSVSWRAPHSLRTGLIHLIAKKQNLSTGSIDSQLQMTEPDRYDDTETLTHIHFRGGDSISNDLPCPSLEPETMFDWNLFREVTAPDFYSDTINSWMNFTREQPNMWDPAVDYMDLNGGSAV